METWPTLGKFGHGGSGCGRFVGENQTATAVGGTLPSIHRFRSCHETKLRVYQMSSVLGERQAVSKCS